MALTSISRARALAARALRSGGIQKSVSTVEWDISGRCEAPIPVEVIGQHQHGRFVGPRAEFRDQPRDRWRGRRAGMIRVRMLTRCRVCQPCQRVRAALWRDRARVEIVQSQRTWFVTFTANAENHLLMVPRYNQRRRKEHKPARDLAGLDPRKQYLLRCDAMGRLLTDYFKRLRKASNANIRYLLISEPHSKELVGFPHFHCLIHEGAGPALTYRHIADQWPHGFIHAKLVDANEERASSYVTKYVMKTAVSRIRASLRYGERTTQGVQSGT